MLNETLDKALYVSPLISHLSMNKPWVCICWINFHGGVKSEMVVNIHYNVIIISRLSLPGYERFIPICITVYQSFQEHLQAKVTAPPNTRVAVDPPPP